MLQNFQHFRFTNIYIYILDILLLIQMQINQNLTKSYNF